MGPISARIASVLLSFTVKLYNVKGLSESMYTYSKEPIVICTISFSEESFGWAVIFRIEAEPSPSIEEFQQSKASVDVKETRRKSDIIHCLAVDSVTE